MMVKETPYRMLDLANQYADRHIQTVKAFGGKLRKRAEIVRDYCEGFESGAKAVAGGELLAENNQLQEMFNELSIGEKRTIAMEQLIGEMSIETAAHEGDCTCVACVALAAFYERIGISMKAGKNG
jgi:hypothetical protein